MVEQQRPHHFDVNYGASEGTAQCRQLLAEAAQALCNPEHRASRSRSGSSAESIWNQKEEEYLKRGQVLVMRADTFDSIAKKALVMRGNTTATLDQIKDEADRIRQLNMKYYPEFEHSHHVSAGMILDVSEPRIGPDIRTAWKQWTDAKPGGTTYVHSGERVVALPGSHVVVEPGGAALVNKGAAAFAFGKSHIEAFGGVTISDGAQVAASDSAVVVQSQGAGTTKPLEAEAALNPELFPRG